MLNDADAAAAERPPEGTTVAVLFCDAAGVYRGVAGTDLWDEARDARKYAGPLPVVCHPPCARWSQLAPVVEARYGYTRHDDGGLFEFALAAVRRWGGVLEHPAMSAAWGHHGLIRPQTQGAWSRGDWNGTGWTTEVAQRHYGHRARKRTWLYSVDCDLPRLPYGDGDAVTAVIGGGSWQGHGLHTERVDGRVVENMDKIERRATPEPFAKMLVEMARTVSRNRAAA